MADAIHRRCPPQSTPTTVDAHCDWHRLWLMSVIVDAHWLTPIIGDAHCGLCLLRHAAVNQWGLHPIHTLRKRTDMHRKTACIDLCSQKIYYLTEIIFVALCITNAGFAVIVYASKSTILRKQPWWLLMNDTAAAVNVFAGRLSGIFYCILIFRKKKPVFQLHDYIASWDM